MKILIIRHGEPDYSIDSLTEKGWREAELLSKRLCGMDIADFYVSPLGRAKDTAKPTMEKLGRELQVLPWLREFHGTVINPNTGETIEGLPLVGGCAVDITPPYLGEIVLYLKEQCPVSQ